MSITDIFLPFFQTYGEVMEAVPLAEVEAAIVDFDDRLYKAATTEERTAEEIGELTTMRRTLQDRLDNQIEG